MADLWLLVDCNYLCWRAFHSTGGLSFNGVATGVSYGVLRELETLLAIFEPKRTILAFDGPFLLREREYPNYKISRKTKVYTDDEKRDRAAFYDEVDRLRSSILPAAGFQNVISVQGYEGDDILAHAADLLPRSLEAVIVSADKDLWQCLRSNVSVYNPASKKLLTARSFWLEWGIEPAQWADVKALEGCGTDDIAGIPGIGPVKAAQWVAGKLKPESVAYQKIRDNLEIYNTNIKLVRLPYPGLTLPPIVPDAVDRFKLAKVKAELGIKIREQPTSPRPTMGFDL